MRASVAYIVLAHRRPLQVARLVRRLSTDRTCLLVHVDRRAGRGVSDELQRAVADVPNVEFLARSRCYWGGFGMVRATLDGLEVLVGAKRSFDHVLVLSGQDYPLRSPMQIESFLGRHLGRSFMTAAALPNEWPGGGLPRIERWHLVSPLVLHLPVPWRRRIPGGLRPYGGGAWVCLAREAAEHVVDVVGRDRRLVRFFEHTLHPDELLFQTIVMNSGLAGTVVDDHLRYIDWSTDPAPATLREADLPAMLASGKLFARKFDAGVDAGVLDVLDARIERETVAFAG